MTLLRALAQAVVFLLVLAGLYAWVLVLGALAS